MYDVITIGSAALRDFTFFIDLEKKEKKFICLPQGAKINVKNSYFTHGGGACNVAVGLTNFGLRVATIVRVGKDYSGQAIIDQLRKRKIDTRFIQIDKKLHTGVSAIIQPKNGKRTILTYRGANDKLEINDHRVPKTKWIYLSSLSGNWRKILNQVFKLKLKNPSIKIAWNPGILQIETGRSELKKFLNKTDILVLNKEEASLLTSQNKGNISFLLKSLYNLCSNVIAVTCGKEGVYVMSKKEIIYQPSPVIKVVDTTGAGDSFSSGFLAGLFIYKDLRKAVKLGVLNSVANLKIVGAQDGLLTKKDLRKLMSN